MKKLFSIFLIMFFVSCGVVYAQGFTKQSFEGNYAAKIIYGDNEGTAMGVINGSGDGSASATLTLNLPGLGLKRVIIPATAVGTYTVETDGPMTVAFTITLENGTKIDETADCVIMQADDNNLATELYCVGREPLTPLRGFKRGGIIVFTCKRLPD